MSKSLHNIIKTEIQWNVLKTYWASIVEIYAKDTDSSVLTGSCVNDQWQQFDKKCFLFSNEKVQGFDKAAEMCKKAYPSARLASIESQAENDWVKG